MKHSINQIDPEILRQLLHYDAETGKLFWRQRYGDGAACWNARWAGKEALTAKRAAGYRHGHVLGVTVQAHRAAFAIFHGRNAPCQVDHINGNKTDNRIENLRAVSNAENQRNMKIPKNNASGAVGVSWWAQAKKWRAFIGVSGKTKHLGSFEGFEEALAARKRAESALGFHPNHGRASDEVH